MPTTEKKGFNQEIWLWQEKENSNYIHMLLLAALFTIWVWQLTPVKTNRPMWSTERHHKPSKPAHLYLFALPKLLLNTGKRPLECTRLAWGAEMNSHSSAWPSVSWNSGLHTCYTTNWHVGLVLPLGSHTLSWPRFVWWVFWVTTTGQARKGWGAGEATGKHNLEALHVWITAPKLHGRSSAYRLSCFLSRMKQSLKEFSKAGYWEETVQGKQELIRLQKILDNECWWAWGGKPQSIYVPYLGQMDAKHGMVHAACQECEEQYMQKTVGLTLKQGSH